MIDLSIKGPEYIKRPKNIHVQRQISVIIVRYGVLIFFFLHSDVTDLYIRYIGHQVSPTIGLVIQYSVFSMWFHIANEIVWTFHVYIQLCTSCILDKNGLSKLQVSKIFKLSGLYCTNYLLVHLVQISTDLLGSILRTFH